MYNSSDTIGNRNRDLPACGELPQANVAQLVPFSKGTIEYYFAALGLLQFKLGSVLFWNLIYTGVAHNEITAMPS